MVGASWVPAALPARRRLAAAFVYRTWSLTADTETAVDAYQYQAGVLVRAIRQKAGSRFCMLPRIFALCMRSENSPFCSQHEELVQPIGGPDLLTFDP
jgi:hypothetical protein